MSQEMRPAMLDRLGLISSIEWLAKNAREYSNIDARVEIRGKEHRLPEEVAVTLFRIIQEALSNIRKHAGATRADIVVEFEKDMSRITISDNGNGFEAPENAGDLAKHGKSGSCRRDFNAQVRDWQRHHGYRGSAGITMVSAGPGAVHAG